MTNDKFPIVSICCVTYNHALFIRKALDGFLMQEPPTGVSAEEHWYEILIHDDCSTDGTTEIIKEYAAKYPDKIFPIYETENQYSKGADMDSFNYNRAKGKYIAYCEGDDYWTDVYKLQKQVDFMESHPDYSVCMHGCSVYDIRSEQMYKSRDFEAYDKSVDKTDNGTNICIEDYFKGFFGQPLTMLFRVSMYNFDWRNLYKYYRDTHEIYHLLRTGKGYWMNFNGGVYIKHNGGISTSVSLDNSCEEEREHVTELYLRNREDHSLRTYLISILLWNHDVFESEDREESFFKIMRTYWRNMPSIAANIYWIVFKRKIKCLFK